MTLPLQTPLTARSEVVAVRFFRIIRAHMYTLGFQSVWFGDQNLIPKTPTVCVEPGTKRRELYASQDHTENNIDTYFLIYHSPISEMQQARRDNIRLAESLERYLHMNHLRLYDASGRQLTVHGSCVELDPGYATKANTLYHTTQITWRSLTKTWLGR